MEAIALSIGVLALVGVFKDWIELISLISASRTLGRDFELLNAKIDIERALLLQWSSRTGLLTREHDKRLDDDALLCSVSLVLSSLRHLLKDSKQLRDRYGLREAEETSEAVTLTMSDSRIKTFTENFRALNLRVTRTGHTFLLRVNCVGLLTTKPNSTTLSCRYLILFPDSTYSFHHCIRAVSDQWRQKIFKQSTT